MARRSWFRRLSAGGLLALAMIATGARAAPLDQLADGYLGSTINLFTPGDGLPSSFGFKTPTAVAVDPATGELWVADFAHRVLRFASMAEYVGGTTANLVLGQSNFGDSQPNRGGAAAANTLWTPAGLAFDQLGRLYVSDSGNHRVLVFTPPFANGMSARYVLGQANFTSALANRGGNPSEATLNTPTGIHIDPRGNLYIADINNHRVVRLDPPAVTGVIWDAVYGQPNFTTTSTPPGENGLALPVAVAVAPNDDLWVVDGANRILRYDQGAAVPAASANKTADAVLCQTDFVTGTPGSGLSNCATPSGITFATDGSFYVSDFANHRILRFAPGAGTGAAAAEVLGQYGVENTCNRNQGGPSNDSFCQPRSPFITRDGDLWVADAGNHRLLRFDLPRARAVPQVTSLGPAMHYRGVDLVHVTVNGNGFDVNSFVAINGVLKGTGYVSPRRLIGEITASELASGSPLTVTVFTLGPGGGTSGGATFTPYNRAYGDKVADRVLFRPTLDSEGTAPEQRLGIESTGLHNGATASTTGRKIPAIDPATGRLFVADEGASRVLSWPSATGFGNGEPADVVLGQPDESGHGCNTGGISAATLCEPRGIAVAANGSLYVSDADNRRIVRYDPPFFTGMAAVTVNGSTLINPSGLAFLGPVLIAADGFRIIRFADPLTSGTFTAPIDGLFAYPRGLAFDAAGRLFVGDPGSVRVYQPAGPGFQLLFSIQASGLAFNTTTSIAIDAGGHLHVADAGNNRVLRFSPPFAGGANVPTGVLGQPDFFGNAAGTSAAGMTTPASVAVDSRGGVYVGEFDTPRLIAFDRPYQPLLDPALDTDGDGIPNGVESGESRDVLTRDNDVFGNTRLFAMQQYRDFLGREGDAAGVNTWTNQVASASMTRAQVVQAFFDSQEFQNGLPQVTRLYFAFFNRIADYPGLLFHTGRYRVGVPLNTIAQDFAGSQEFQITYGSLDNGQYVDLVYQNVLGRPADPAGRANALAQLDGNALTRGELMVAFSESQEHLNRSASKVFVTAVYVGMLRRSPDAPGLQNWVNAFSTGMPRVQMLGAFLDSAEYHNRFLP